MLCIEVNGNGKTFNGQGEQYWDGLGELGSTKPHPMMKWVSLWALLVTSPNLN